MTPANPFERFVEDWLAAAAGPMDVPGDLHTAVVEQARRTRQSRPGVRFPGSPLITDSARVAIDLAAIVVLAVAAVNVLSPFTTGGGPGTDPRSAAPSPNTGSATPPATPSESPGVDPIQGDYSHARQSLMVDGITFSFAIEAAGWEPHDGFQISKSFVRGQSAEGVLFWTAYPDSQKTFSCFDKSGPTLRSAHQLADAVAGTRGLVVVAGPSEVTIGDRSAYRVIATVRDDEGCDPGYIYNWKVNDGAFWTRTHVGDRITVWVMEVEGRILVIGGLLSAELAPNVAAVHEIEAIVSSMQFD
ncbi:MAG: hypothetical protein L0227_09200 [Chloroflexi bacterium]|nr:hypothetical protein [Chloroflexota bacterium]